VSAQALEVPKLPRQLTPRVHWLGVCGVNTRFGAVVHIHRSCYLVVGDDATLLVDTGTPPDWRKLQDQLDRVLGDRPLDWVYATHPEPPHASNTALLLDRYPRARVIGDVRDLHLYFPAYRDRFVRARPGERVDLGGTSVEFVAPAFYDLPATLWAYETAGQVLFVADGFAYAHHVNPEGTDAVEIFHLEGECALTSSELPGTITPQQMAFVLKAALWWSRYVPVAPFFGRLQAIFDRYPPKFVGPAHGNVVSDLADIMPVMKKAYELAYDG
jgi:hypothetical protein